MLASKSDYTPWVFLSHSSADIVKVRQIRNFMEERGAGPILFYLRALTNPELFWPLIEQEIAARNFFLLCDSQSARKSPWVQREWDSVEKISKQKAIRVGRMNVDAESLDMNYLSRYLLNLQVFLIAREHELAFSVLERFGYRMIGSVAFSTSGLQHLGDGSQMSNDMIDTLYFAAKQGWLLIVLDEILLESENFWRELPAPSSSERLMFVLPEMLALCRKMPQIPQELLVIQKNSYEDALIEAAQRMLLGGPQ